MQNFKKIKSKLESMSQEQVVSFLSSYSSKLKDKELHCKDLIDLETGLPFITSVLASGLTVINNTTYYPNMTEKIYLKAKSILGYSQNNKFHNYSDNEILFTLGFITLYHKLDNLRIKVS